MKRKIIRQQRSKYHINKWTILAVLTLCAFFAVLHWNSFNSPFERDEGEYAYSAWIMRQGITPYENSFLQKPPMIIYTYLFGQLINPTALWMPRLLAAFFVGGIVILTGMVAWREYGKGTGRISLFIVLPMLLFPPLSPFAANTEKFMLLPLMGALTLYAFNRNNIHGLPWFWCGVLGALAILYKPIALPALLYIFLVWFIEVKNSKGRSRSIWQNPLLGLIGAIMASVLALGYFIIKGAGGALWESAVGYNQLEIKSFGSSFSSLSYYLSIFLHYWWILFILSAWYLWKRPPHWWVYLGLMVVSVLTVYAVPSGLGHFYLLLMPFWAIVIASGISMLSDLLKVRVGLSHSAPWLAAGTILIMLYPIRDQFFLSPVKLNEWIYGTVNPFTESAEVAKHVSALTLPQDRIFVAGSEPQIYYYAQRRSISRFVITYPLNVPTAKREIYQREVIKDLQEKVPKIIVVSRSMYSSLWEPKSPTLFLEYLNKLLGDRYEMIGGIVWIKGGAYSWQETIGKGGMQATSLLVFKLYE